jgi:hypothetical protein
MSAGAATRHTNIAIFAASGRNKHVPRLMVLVPSGSNRASSQFQRR